MKTRMILTTATILFAVIFGAIGNGQGWLNKKTEPSFNGAAYWLNSQPLTLQGLHGRVLLIDFCTYTCVNWRRTLPYVREWASKYKDQGLVVVGVHTPEFSFEQKQENVICAIKEMKITYPIVMDNNFEIWHSFNNEYWPAMYLIDANGQIRYHKFGEGDYHESEAMIQQLLEEASSKNVFDTPVALNPDGFEAAADWQNLQSPENYVGYSKAMGFVSRQGAVPDKRELYSAPGQLKLNQWGLSGEWMISNENIHLRAERGKIIYRFHARDLNLIMGLAAPGTSEKFRVLINGNPPGAAHGLDIDSSGNGRVSRQRMYQLVRQQGPIIDRDFEIEFFGPGVEVYDFTFG
jgi:hypothetical protein